MKLTLQQLEAHLWGAANILRGKTAGQDYKNYILSLMFYKRLCDQWARNFGQPPIMARGAVDLAQGSLDTHESLPCWQRHSYWTRRRS